MAAKKGSKPPSNVFRAHAITHTEMLGGKKHNPIDREADPSTFVTNPVSPEDAALARRDFVQVPAKDPMCGCPLNPPPLGSDAFLPEEDAARVALQAPKYSRHDFEKLFFFAAEVHIKEGRVTEAQVALVTDDDLSRGYAMNAAPDDWVLEWNK